MPRAIRASGEAPLPTRLARMPVVGDIGIYFKPERLVRRSLARGLRRPRDGDARARSSAIAELQRFPGNREATLQRARTQEPLDPTPLKRLDVPTLIIWGAKDRWVPVADAFRFQNDIKGAKLEIFENLGHNPMEEDPKATAAAVAAFLASTPAPPAAARSPRRRRSPCRPIRPVGASGRGAGEGLGTGSLMRCEQRHHLGEGLRRRSPRSLPWCGSGSDAGRRRRPARSPANRFAPRRRRRTGGDDVDAGQAASVEIMKVVQTARCAGASIA